jgi:Type IV secretion-system coupling protein DNA-binding domain
MARLYLNQTPFENFWLNPIPFSIPEKTRFEHMHLVAGSGHGKTQTLQNLILSDLSKVATGERSVIVIDSQGDMINNFLALAAVGELSDRVVLIYPKDIQYPPALNLFDFGLDRLGRYNEVQQEMLFNGAISLYEYVFGALLGAALTQRQGVIFRYLARLLMVVPGANIHTLMDFMQSPESVRPYLANVDDPVTRRFFETQFFSKAFDDTRQQILTRLWGILSNRVLARMFESKRNKVNVFDSMNKGSLILIYTAKELLKQEGCEIFGRFFISLIAQAAQERASMAEERRTPTFVYIDEAHDYFDESIETLLVQARKYNVGMVIANQFLDQFDRRLLAAVNTNTAIKMVGGLSNDDARDFAREMNCERELIQSMQKVEGMTQFACSVKNHPASPIRLKVPLGLLEQQPKINPYVWKALVERSRELYCRDLSAEHPDEPDLPPEYDSPLGDPDPL